MEMINIIEAKEIEEKLLLFKNTLDERFIIEFNIDDEYQLIKNSILNSSIKLSLLAKIIWRKQHPLSASEKEFYLSLVKYTRM